MEFDIYLIDDKEYCLIKKNEINNICFCYFMNKSNYKDIIIKKYDENKNIVAITEEEFELAIKNI